MTITAADIRRDVKEKDIKFLRLMFTDILGTLKNVEVPATDEQLDKLFENKMMFDGSSIEGFLNQWKNWASRALTLDLNQSSSFSNLMKMMNQHLK